MVLRVPKRLLQRWTLRREQFGAVLQNMHVVFQSDAELSANVDSRLIAEGHLRLKFCRIAAHQIRPLVSIHAHAVSQAMREVFEVWAVARIGDYLARGRID